MKRRKVWKQTDGTVKNIQSRLNRQFGKQPKKKLSFVQELYQDRGWDLWRWK